MQMPVTTTMVIDQQLCRQPTHGRLCRWLVYVRSEACIRNNMWLFSKYRVDRLCRPCSHVAHSSLFWIGSAVLVHNCVGCRCIPVHLTPIYLTCICVLAILLTAGCFGSALPSLFPCCSQQPVLDRLCRPCSQFGSAAAAMRQQCNQQRCIHVYLYTCILAYLYTCIPIYL